MKHESDTHRLATSGIISALAIVVLMLGVLPNMLFIGIYGSIMTSIILLDKYGLKYYYLSYFVISVLGIIIVPNLELTLTYICMGWYPIIKYIADRKSRIIGRIIKILISIISSCIIYNISIMVFGEADILGNEYTEFLKVGYVLIFCSIFMLLDWMINFERKQIYKMLKLRFRYHTKNNNSY